MRYGRLESQVLAKGHMQWPIDPVHGYIPYIRTDSRPFRQRESGASRIRDFSLNLLKLVKQIRIQVRTL